MALPRKASELGGLSRKTSDLSSRKAQEDAEKKRKLEEGALKFKAKALGMTVADVLKMERAAEEKEAERQRMLRDNAVAAQMTAMGLDPKLGKSHPRMDVSECAPIVQESSPATTFSSGFAFAHGTTVAATSTTAGIPAPPLTSRSASRRFSMPEASYMAKASSLEAAAKSILGGPAAGGAPAPAPAPQTLKTVPSIIFRKNEVIPDVPSTPSSYARQMNGLASAGAAAMGASIAPAPAPAVARAPAPAPSPPAAATGAPSGTRAAAPSSSPPAAPHTPAVTTRPSLAAETQRSVVTATTSTAAAPMPAMPPPTTRGNGLSPVRRRPSVSGPAPAADAFAAMTSPSAGRRRPSIPTDGDAALAASLAVTGAAARIDDNPLSSLGHVPGGAPLAVSPRRKSQDGGSSPNSAFFGKQDGDVAAATQRSNVSAATYTLSAGGTVGNTIAAARAVASAEEAVAPHPPVGPAPARPSGSPSMSGAPPRRRAGSVLTEKAPTEARAQADIPVSVTNSMGRRASTGGLTLTPLTQPQEPIRRSGRTGSDTADNSGETVDNEGDPVLDPALHNYAQATRTFAAANAGFGEAVATALHLVPGKSATPVSTTAIVRRWLEALELSQYCEALLSNGFDSLSRMAMLDGAALSACMPTLPYGHRMQLLTAAGALREQLIQRTHSFSNVKRSGTPSAAASRVGIETVSYAAGLGPGTLLPLVVVVRRD